MQEETCEPIAVCQGTDNLEDGFVDPRSFCFNISANVENICRPKSCPIQKIGEKAETPDVDDDIFGKDTKTFLIPMKGPATQCVPWQARGPKDTDEPGSGRHPESGVTQSGAIAPSGQPGQIPEGSLSILGSRQLTSAGGSKSAPPSIMSDGGAVQSGVQGSVPSGSLHSEREAAGLARLVGLDQGPASILASFGDVESAKESLASMGAVSMGGALVCECCKCEPCTCGPRGLNLQNLMAALKAMMGSGEDLKKLVGALGPGAFEAMETIRQKEGEATALWEAAEERVSETAALEGKLKILDSRKETPSEIALREAWMRGDFEEMKSCHCLPGMCPCPGGHYVLKQKKVKEPVKKEKKKIKKVRKKVKKIGKDGKEHETWEWATPSDSDKEGRLSGTCICPPTKHYLTPVSSETEISGPYYPTSKKIHWADLMVCTCPRLQRTLAILKPEVVKFKDVVKRAIKNYGMDILAERSIQLSPEEASELYAKYYGLSTFPNLIVSISQAPVLVLSIGGVDVVKIWSNLIGPDGVLPREWFLPDWIARKYGFSEEIPDALHGSKNPSTAEKENRYFFPESIIDPVMRNEEDVKDFIKKFVNPTLLKGLAILAKTRPIDPLIFLAEWLVNHNPFQPYFPPTVCLAPT